MGSKGVPQYSVYCTAVRSMVIAVVQYSQKQYSMTFWAVQYFSLAVYTVSVQYGQTVRKYPTLRGKCLCIQENGHLWGKLLVTDTLQFSPRRDDRYFWF